MIKKYRELQCVCSHSPGYVSMFHPAKEETSPFQINKQTNTLFRSDKPQQQSSKSVRKKMRQGRVSNVTCWASEEKQHCMQAQKTQSDGVHEPLQNFVEHLPILTYITATLQLKCRQLRLCFHMSALATILSQGALLPPLPHFTDGQFQVMKQCIISSIVLYNWLWGHAVNWSRKWGIWWATGTDEYCQSSIMVSTKALLYCNYLHVLTLTVRWVLKNGVDYADLCITR